MMTLRIPRTLTLLSALVLAFFLAPTPAIATQIWSGARQTFTKVNYADWTQAANQDRITTNVWLTRKSNQSMYNYFSEPGYVTNTISPAGTEWAYGTTADLPLTFKSFVSWNGNNPAGVIGSNAVLHLIADDIYLDIKFTAWTGGNGGGGFAYERAGAVALTLNGASTLYVQQSSEFVDPGATAADSSGTVLTVDVTGTVDTGTLGEYFLDYTATDSRGYTASVRRTVIVMNQVPILWNGPRVTFTKADYADYTSVSNQDRLTSAVWLTRQNNDGLFNIYAESSYSAASSPYATAWAFGSTSNLFGLSYLSLGDLAASVGGPENLVNSNLVLRLPDENTCIDIKFTAWTPDATGGGGFSYERAKAPASITLNGTAVIQVIRGSDFIDPGVIALDAYSIPLLVTTNGTVDTATLGTYDLIYSTTSGGYTSSVPRQVRVVTSIPKIWNSVQRMTFTKADYADWTLAANQDRITTNVWVTRQNIKGLFNIVRETYYDNNADTAPSDTEWAYGTTANLESLSFQNWRDWARFDGQSTPDIVGQDAVMHLISDDIYIDIKFIYWSQNNGGGFAYERASPVIFTMNGDANMSLMQNDTFTDSGVTAIDALGNPLEVTTNGAVNVSIPGNYTLIYTATGADGWVASVVRSVHVTPLPTIWNGPRVTFTKPDYADWTAATNQDRITPNVWVTRQDDEGLFNIKLESGYEGTTPSDTEWAYGTTADLESLTFTTWHEWSRSEGGTPSIIGGNAVLHLISENIYIDIKFKSWTIGEEEGPGGGGFSYERAKAPASIVLIGSSLIFVQQGGAFVDPGASALDVAGNPITVTTNGTVDTATLGTYVLTYSATAGGYTPSVTRKVRVVATLPEIWNGQHITFVKKDYADWTDPANQDCITTNVWLTRQDDEGIFNIAQEVSYDKGFNTMPADTEWAFGTTANLDLTFMPWYDWVQSDDGPPSTVGRDAVVHLISDDIYIDIKFTSWTENGNGGGFSYERAGVVFVTLAGNPSMAWLLNTPFVDPGATAVDLDGNPLAVTTNGTVNSDSLGDYTLSYTATDAKGRIGIVKRTVRVMESLPQIWNGPRLTFTKPNNADWTDPTNQDRLTPNVALTRQSTRGLFNIAQEASYGYGSPSDTEWAFGTTADLWELSFQNWHDWSRADGPTPSMVGRDAVVHLLAEDIYIDIRFTSWTSGQGEGGGGFAYERARAFVTATLNGSSAMYVWLDGAFTDPGAAAADCYGSPLAVTTNGMVNTGAVGDYELTYTATDAVGHAASVTRTVHVVADMPAPQISAMPSYSQNAIYANTVLNIPIMVWGRVWNGVPPYAYTLDYGDGSEPQSGTVNDPKFIGQTHAYTSGGSKTATLSVTDGLGRTVTRQAVIRVFLTATHDIRINMATEKGLLWSFRHQTVVDTNRVCWATGNGGEYDIGASGASILAFQENGHHAFNDLAQDVYAESVQKGLNWLLDNGSGSYYSIYPHSDGLAVRDSDSNGNGKGAYLTSSTYADALATMALILSQPSAEAASNTMITAGPFAGVSYYTLVQDILDQYAFSQGDGAYRGGWRYNVNVPDSCASSGGLDGSAQQWPCLNFKAAGDRWGLHPPDWVITNAVHAYQQLQNSGNGGCGYSGSDAISGWLNIAKSGGMLVAYKLGGKEVGDPDVNHGLQFIGNNWTGTPDPGWAGDLYAMYGPKKGLQLLGLSTIATSIGERNWYNDLSAWLLGNAEGSTPEGMPFVPSGLASSYQTTANAFGQNTDGSWNTGRGYISQYPALCTPVAVLILAKSVTVSLPVASIAPVGPQPVPLAGYAPLPFAMNGSSSYHQDPTKTIVEYLWDWDASNGVDWSNPDASGPRPINPGYTNAGNYTVSLRVKDNSVPPLYDTKTLVISVTEEPLPPVAVAIPPGHPAYAGRIGQDIVLDGSASYDPNGYSITNYIWDLNGNGIYGDTGDVASTNPTSIVHFDTEYVGALGLQVAANGRTGSSLSQINVYATSNDLSVVSFEFTGGTFPALADVHAVLLDDAGSSQDFNNVLVRFYNGNPLTSGSQISSNHYVSLTRGVPVSLDTRLNLAGVSATNIYIYVDANDAIPESDELNNLGVLSSVPRYALSLSVSPPAGGAILAAPPADGDGLYGWGTTAGLTATPASGWHFTGWSGDLGGLNPTNNPLGVVVQTNQALVANFVADTPPEATLEIRSSYGAGQPAVGMHSNTIGAVLTNAMTNPDPLGGTQYVCTGWSMDGNEPAGGTATQCVMTVSGNAVLTWLWTTNYWLETACSNGCINVATGWQPSGVTTQIVATANPYYDFTNWTGSVESYSRSLDLPMDAPKSLQAHFVAMVTTNTGTPQWWLAQHGLTNDFEQESTSDVDGDGMTASQEFLAGTDPTNRDSVLSFTYTAPEFTGIGVVVRWQSVDGKFYRLERGTNLSDNTPFGVLVRTNIPGFAPANTETDTTAVANGSWFYRVILEP